jgi:hypothetical protein
VPRDSYLDFGQASDEEVLDDLAGPAIHIDETRAVEPLERTGGWALGEPPETYPSAL